MCQFNRRGATPSRTLKWSALYSEFFYILKTARDKKSITYIYIYKNKFKTIFFFNNNYNKTTKNKILQVINLCGIFTPPPF